MKNAQTKNLLDELGLSGLPEEKQMDLLTLMTETLLKRITIEVLQKLTDADKKEFDQLREAGDAKKIIAFLKAKIDNYDQLVAEIATQFKEEMKEDLRNM